MKNIGSEAFGVKWKTLEYSKNQVIKAGKSIRDLEPSSEDYKRALVVVDNWRGAHAFPLQVFYCNLNRKFGQYIVAQRIKRLNSIVEKLRREPRMNLWEMQDLGGCRIIVPIVADVWKVVEEIQISRMRHKPRPWKNYIEDPKPNGYRSFHLIYRYRSDKKEEYNQNMLIEIQVRTRLQHLWATAVETMGNVVGTSLKSSIGDPQILRFFALVSSLFAQIEGTPIVPGCPDTLEETIDALVSLDKDGNYLDKLDSINLVAYEHESIFLPTNGYAVLELVSSNRLGVHSFKPSEVQKATDLLQELEINSNSNAVLVRVSSLKWLRSAYPNYYLDIEEFTARIRSEIYGDTEAMFPFVDDEL